jgi:hypothetical protein
MGEIIRFVPKSELERTRLIREARAIYDSIFPPTDVAREEPDGATQKAQPSASDAILLGKRAVKRE